MEVDPPVVQPKKTWVAIAVEGARPSAKAKTTPVPKAEPKGKAASVPEAKSAQAPRAESKETKQADPKVEVKKEKVSGDDAPGDSRGSAEGQERERKSRWDPDEPAKESTKREASKRPDDVDSRPGAAAREASGDDLHSALGRSSAKDMVAPLTASKAMAKKPEGSEVGLQSAELQRARRRVISWRCRRIQWWTFLTWAGQGFHQKWQECFCAGGSQPDSGELSPRANASGFGCFPHSFSEVR